MPRFAEVSHDEWIAAPEATVRGQFADLEHHIAANVHPKLSFRILAQGPLAARYEQRVKLLGITQRDVFERRFSADGSMVDTSIEGFNRGGSLSFAFRPESRRGVGGTLVRITVRLPLPPVLGPLVRPLLQAQVRKELAAAAAEDKRDLESGGYRPAQAGRGDLPAAAAPRPLAAAA
ncbi:MAG: hypothetical protein JNJ89_11435 [Rubrivivax sp.]|nr:hypothetical protein [Rubrivivax sp.]